MPDGVVRNVQGNVVDKQVDKLQDIHDKISEIDLDGNVRRELRGIRHADKGIDYDNLEDPNQKKQYDARIAGIEIEAKNWKKLEEKEPENSIKKELFKLANDFCVVKKSEMELRAGLRPKSEDAQKDLDEESRNNDLTRFERFKRWAKENIAGVSAVAISIAGIVTAVVMTGRNAIKKAAKPVGQFGKALANVAKKAGLP